MKELNDGGVIAGLRALYRKNGYLQYHMSKFEEYDLYARNKDFLISEGVITFNDTDGRLLALKPDVTLSIIKNGSDADGMQKVYYDENVYRVSGSTRSFRELRQLGLECIGEIDDYCIFEVLNLSLQSLKLISDNYLLDISHGGIISSVLDSFNLNTADKEKAISFIAEKNPHELKRLLGDSENGDKLLELTRLYGRPAEVLPKLEKLLYGLGCDEAIAQLKKVTEGLQSDRVHIDFSVEGSMRYYNGIVFKGFIEGVPESVLSGGQYDPLLKKMKRKCGAIGFALYLDSLERLWQNNNAYALDAVLLYNDGDDINLIERACSELRGKGESVAALKKAPHNIRYKRLLRFKDGEVAVIEENA